MSLEAYRPQPQLVEVSHPTTSSRMEQVVTQLAATYNIDLSQKGVTLTLDVPEHKQRWMIGTFDEQRVGITRCTVDQNNGLIPEVDMVFEVKPEGWEPVEIVHSEQVWQDYTHAMQAAGQSMGNQQGDFNFASFTEYLALNMMQWIV